MDRQPVCSVSCDASLICLECPFNSETNPARWKFVTSRAGDLRQAVSRLSGEGIDTRIVEISPLSQRPSLTRRQKEILAMAVANGYFEFPRRISLTGLSKMVMVKPSTLSEILRSAERNVMESAAGNSFLESQTKPSPQGRAGAVEPQNSNLWPF